MCTAYLMLPGEMSELHGPSVPTKRSSDQGRHSGQRVCQTVRKPTKTELSYEDQIYSI